MTDVKYCKWCDDYKSLSSFSKHINSKDGLNSYCRQCVSIKQKERYLRDKDLKREYHKNRYDNDPEYRKQTKENVKAWVKSHKSDDNESEIQYKFELMLQALSVRHESKVNTEYGQIDLVLHDPYKAIVEIKNGVISTQIQQALGQLLIYKLAHPMAKLYAYFPMPIPEHYVYVYACYGIEIWDWDKFCDELNTKRKEIGHIVPESQPIFLSP